MVNPNKNWEYTLLRMNYFSQKESLGIQCVKKMPSVERNYNPNHRLEVQADNLRTKNLIRMIEDY